MLIQCCWGQRVHRISYKLCRPPELALPKSSPAQPKIAVLQTVDLLLGFLATMLWGYC